MRVLITGCSSGIGRASAIELVARGHSVVATARDVGTLQDLDGISPLGLDVTDPHSVAAAIEAAGPIDGLVNNAGISVSGPIECVPMDEVRRLFETNLFAGISLIQAAVPGMRARGGGVVVNISSSGGQAAFPLHGLYSASKSALEAVTEALHYELAPFGIRVAILQPGFFATNISSNARRFGQDAVPYAQLRDRMAANAQRQVGAQLPGPERVAVAVADAIEQPGTPLRVPVGADAEALAAARAQLNDAEFEAWLRELMGLAG
jgi:NAD(P)-dependent dehydrogenase (short-subunit alcohol dehydrogenase family)